MSRSKIGTAILTVFALSSAANASWLSKITGVSININNPLKPTVKISAPDVKAIPEMLKNLPKDVGQALLNPAGSALAVLIRNAKQQASPDSQPLPAEIRQLFSPYFPPEVLDRARWSLYRSGRVSLDGLIAKWFQSEGAVTLDNIIVFSSREAMQNQQLWAHELTHVMQYRNMGVEGFASVYSVASWEVEQQARDMARNVNASIVRNRASGQISAPSYSVDTTAFKQALDNTSIQQEAQRFYPAQSCMNISGNIMSNACPVPVRITDFVYPDLYGRAIWTPCYDNPPYSSCLIPSGYWGPALTPSGGPVLSYNFIYAR